MAAIDWYHLDFILKPQNIKRVDLVYCALNRNKK